jgi:alpha-L-rhamnosidase
MKQFITSILKLLLVLLFIQSLQTKAALPNAPINLRCFDKSNPVGVNDKPYFGWYVTDPDKNEIQSAYQILVASSPEKLKSDNGDVWNSNKVSSRNQNYVFFAGKNLSPATKYYWKVRTWDKDGNVGPYAAPSYFGTGLFTNSDWVGAKWIKRTTTSPDDYTFFRKKTTLPAKSIQRAIVYLNACQAYDLYVNGKFIGRGTDNHYPQYSYYNAWDITSALTSNKENVIACLTHWYGGGQGRAPGSRGLIVKTIIEYSDLTTSTICSDSTWKQKQAEQWVQGQPQRGGEGNGRVEKIDARLMIPDWNTLRYNDSNWQAATEIGAHPSAPWTGTLRSDLTRVVEKEIKPVSVTDLGGGKYVIDLGKIYPGNFKITFSGGKEGDVITMNEGFLLNNDGSVDLKNTQSTNMSFSFILNGKTAVFNPAVYLGPRYMQVNNSPCVLTKENVSYVVRHFELDPSRSQFNSSDPMLTKVWDLMKHSLIVGCMEGFVDTPTREKGAFLGDGWSQAVPSLSVMGDRTMNLRVLQEFLDSQDQYWPDGRLNAVYPNVDGARDIPDYTQSYLVWIWDYYLQTGNVEFLKSNYSRLKKVCDYVNTYKNDTTGLIHKLKGGGGSYLYGIIDWPPAMRYGYDVKTESRTVVDAYAYIDNDIISKVAGVLGNTADRDLYEAKANDLRKAINTLLINKDGVYIDGIYGNKTQSTHVSQHANMYPLAMGIVPEKNLPQVIDAVKSRKMSVGMVTVRYLPEALGQADQGPHMIDLYTNTEWDGWAKIIKLGGTATWESWDANTTNNSMSHPWGAAGLMSMQEYILGINALKPQHELVQIKPLDFGDKLLSASGVYPTDKGDIVISWKKSTKNYDLTLTLPVNITAKVYLPKGEIKGSSIKVDGVVTKGTIEGNYLFVENIGSGKHAFMRQ